MNLSFNPVEECGILNAPISDSDTGSVAYTAETRKHTGGTLATMSVTRLNQIDGSAGLAFRILWKGIKESLEV